MAYDRNRGVVVLFGGHISSSPSYLGDFWEWDETQETWTERALESDTPTPRNSHAMAYDSARNKVVLFGGFNYPDYCEGTEHRCGDTWEFDGVTGNWTDRMPSGETPTARNSHSMAYDSDRGRTTLFGGVNYDGCNEGAGNYCAYTWEWNGTAGTWKKWTMAADAEKPSARSGLDLAYHSTRDKVVLFGGITNSDCGEGADNYCAYTWEWDEWGIPQCANETDPCWKQVSATGPTARSNHAMAYDRARGTVVLFGGDNSHDCAEGSDSDCGYTWEWGIWGSQICANEIDPCWKLAATTGPIARSFHCLAFDNSRGKIVLFGGIYYTQFLSHSFRDTWEWDGELESWEEKTPTVYKPSSRWSSAMVYDSTREKMVLFGGYDGGDRLSETWEWDGSASERAAQLIEVPFITSRADKNASIEKVAVSGWIGGAGNDTSGAVLNTWDEGLWKEIGVNDSDPDSPGLVQWSLADSTIVRRLFYGDGLALNFAATPTNPNGQAIELSRIAVDYIEIRVKYHIGGNQLSWGFDSTDTCNFWQDSFYSGADESCEGWTVDNASTPCSIQEPDEWCITVDTNEIGIASPYVFKDAGKYQYLQIHANNRNAETEVSFSWQLSDESDFVPGRILAIDVGPDMDDTFHTYKIPLDHPDWEKTDRIIRLRLDLPDTTEGDEFAIDWIRLTGEFTEYSCDNFLDDDADSLTDCHDDDCFGDDACPADGDFDGD